MPHRPPSLRDRLARDLADIEGQIQALLDIFAIRYINPNRHDNSFVVIGAADYGWAPSDDRQQLARMKLTRDYDAWYARFRTLFGGITPERKKSIEEADRFAREWITRADTWDHSVPRTIAEAKVLATQSLAPLWLGWVVLIYQGVAILESMVADLDGRLDRDRRLDPEVRRRGLTVFPGRRTSTAWWTSSSRRSSRGSGVFGLALRRPA